MEGDACIECITAITPNLMIMFRGVGIWAPCARAGGLIFLEGGTIIPVMRGPSLGIYIPGGLG